MHLLILLIKLLHNCLPVGSSSQFQSRQFWPAGGCLAKNYIFSPTPTWVGLCDKCSSVEYEQKCYVSEADMPFLLFPHPLACVGVFDILGRPMLLMTELLSLGPWITVEQWSDHAFHPSTLRTSAIHNGLWHERKKKWFLIEANDIVVFACCGNYQYPT